MRRAFVAVSGLVGAAVLLAGCTSGSSGSDSPQSSFSAASSSSQQLDTGTFATTVRKSFGVSTTDTNLLALESQRMAEFVSLPQQIDERLSNSTYAGRPYGATSTVGSIKQLFAADNSAIPKAVQDNNYLAGMFGSAKTTTPDTPTTPVRELTHGVIRFLAPADATKAGQAIADAYGSAPADFADPKVPPTRQTFASLPDTTVFKTAQVANKSTWLAITVHRYFVIVDRLYTANGENIESFVQRSLAEQIPLIDRFPLTLPTKGGAKIQQDQNKILVYTLANPNPSSDLNDGIYGPHGIAFQYNGSVTVMRQLEAAGVAHVASAGTNVFRAATPDKAATVQRQLVESYTKYGSSTESGAPGVPGSACIYQRNTFVCYVTVGRYVGEVAQGDQTQAHQQLAAQYKVLLQADQNVPN